MRVVRQIVYDGTEEQLDKQLSRSLPDGNRQVAGLTISVYTIEDERPRISIADIRTVLERHEAEMDVLKEAVKYWKETAERRHE